MLGDMGTDESVSGNVCDERRRKACEIKLLLDSSFVFQELGGGVRFRLSTSIPP